MVTGIISTVKEERCVITGEKKMATGTIMMQMGRCIIILE